MITRTLRTIAVFQAQTSKAAVQVELEGDTFSVQIADLVNPANKLKFVVPKNAAYLLTEVMTRALAIEADTVVEMGLVSTDSGSTHGVPVGN